MVRGGGVVGGGGGGGELGGWNLLYLVPSLPRFLSVARLERKRRRRVPPEATDLFSQL